jgi:DNA-binding NarL/FixJ family response regulator
VLLKKHYGKYDIRLFSDFMHGGAKAEKIIKHDIALIFTSQNLEQSVNVIESLVSLHQQYNSKTRLLVFYDDERVVKLLSILGISVELVSTRIPLYSLQEKIQNLLESKEPGGIKMQKTRELSPAESDVIFNLLRGDSLLHIAQKRGTHPKTIFSQKYSAMKKLRLRSMSSIFVASK